MGNIFFERYSLLCKTLGKTPNSVAKDIGASSGSVTAWKNGTEPRYTTVAKIADYFDTTVDYLLGRSNDPENTDRFGVEHHENVFPDCSLSNEKTPILTKKDERDIATTMEQLISQLSDGDALMFDGDPMSDEARESMLSAMRLGLEAAKIKNKERFTPKKYKKG